MGKPSPPTPPDPTVVANAQSAANIASATAQQKLNMVSTASPYGATGYSADPSAPGGYKQTTTLSPAEQTLFNQSTALQSGALGTAQKALTSASSALGHPLTPPTLNTSAGYDKTAADAFYNQGASRLDPQYEQADSQMRSRLAAQGLVPGTKAYDDAYGNFSRAKNDAYGSLSNEASVQGSQLGLQQGAFDNNAQQQNFSNQATAQNMPINQLTGLLGLGQVQSPSAIPYSPSSVAPTDVTGAYALNAQQQNANYNSQMQNSAAGLGGLFNLGSSILGAPAKGGSSIAANLFGF